MGQRPDYWVALYYSSSHNSVGRLAMSLSSSVAVKALPLKATEWTQMSVTQNDAQYAPDTRVLVLDEGTL